MQVPDWLATCSLFTVLSSAYAMWLQPCGSSADMLKSSRCRLEPARPIHAMPRLQMSPTCIGVLVIWVTAHAAPDGPACRFRDCAAKRFQGQGPTPYATV